MNRSRLYDLAAVSPLIAWYALGAYGLLLRVNSEFTRGQPSLRLTLQISSEIVTVIFLGLQVGLFIVRRLPIAKEKGWVPRISAIVGANCSLALLALPRVEHGIVLTAVGCILVTAGTLLAIGVASWLGRSFSIFPQARVLKTSGPYSMIRHPLYLSEALVTLGAMWQFQQPWAAVVALLTLAAQLPRMHFEEKILSKTFPEYAQYRNCTWRIIPGLY